MPAASHDSTTDGSVTVSTGISTSRLPSTRPLDHRWDSSRGIIFANARRNQDFTWTPSGGVTFSTSQTHAKSRALGSVPSLDQAVKPGKPSPTKPLGSLVDNPHRAPPIRLSSHDDKISELGTENARLNEQIDAERSRSDDLAREKVKLQEEITLLKQQRQSDNNKAQQSKRNHEIALATVCKEAESELESIKSRLQHMAAVDARNGRDSERDDIAKQHRQETEALEEQHVRELADQRQALEREYEDKLRAVTRQRGIRDSERRTYDDYRKVFDDFGKSVAAFYKPIIDIENSVFFKAAQFGRAQPSYSAQMDKINPLITRTQAKLFQNLDAFLLDTTDRAKASVEAIKSLRSEQQAIADALGYAGHKSRRLTRFHRVDPQNKLSAADVAYWIANDAPFSEYRDQLDHEIRHLREKNKPLAARDEEQLRGLQRDRATLNRVLEIHRDRRDAEALRALCEDNFAEKEVFVTALTVSDELVKAGSAWTSLTGEVSWAEDDGAVSRSEQRAERTAYVEDARQTRKRLGGFQDLVRRRVLLQQQLGQIPPGREVEIDAVIQERIALKRVEERRAFARLGIARSTRSSSFARASSAPASRSLKLSYASQKEFEQSELPKTRRARSSSVPTSLPSSQQREITNVETEIAQRRIKMQKIPPGDGRTRELDAMTTLRKRLAELMLPRLEAKRKALLRQSPVNQNKLHYISSEINRRKATIAGQQPGIERLMSRSAPAHGRARKRSVELRSMQRERGAPRQSDSTLGDAPESSLESRLNFSPSVAKSAAHDFTPAALRHFHATGMAQNSVAVASRLPHHPHFASIARGHVEVKVNSDKKPTMPELCVAQRGMQSMSSDGASVKRMHTQPTTSNAVPPGSPNNYASLRDNAPTDTITHERLPKAGTSRSSDTITPGVSSATINKQQLAEAHRPMETFLTYRIPPEDYRTAVTASPNTNAAYWSYRLYRDAAGKAPSVHYCSKLEYAERELQHFVGRPVLGFDIEWEPGASKKSSAKQNVSLIQIACEDRICLIHVANFFGDTAEQLMSGTLRQILESDRVVKAGVNIGGDARRIQQHLGVDMRGQFELSYLFKVVTFSREAINRTLKGAGLAAQVQSVLLLPLKKDEVRVSSWSKPLSKEQSDYSASDAYAGFQLFHALEAKRRAMHPIPPRPAFRELEQPLVLGDGTVLRPKPRKLPAPATDGKAEELDDEADEEFFDAVETQDAYELGNDAGAAAPASGAGVTYPALPRLDASESAPASDRDTALRDDMNHTPRSNTAKQSSNPSTPSLNPKPPLTPEMHLAETWLTAFKSTLPSAHTLQAKGYSLRAYHLWHAQGFDIPQTAALARDPPLAPTTVASYILEAIKWGELPFDVERVREPLGLLPGSVHGRYRKVVERVRGGG